MHHVRNVEFDAAVHKALACESIGNRVMTAVAFQCSSPEAGAEE